MSRFLRAVVMRSDRSEHRPATPLELLFDLCFVVAVAALAAQLHHDISHGHGLDGAPILAVSVAIRDSLAVDQLLGPGLVIATAALLIAFALWWTYFDTVGSEGLTRNRRAAFTWGYGHYMLFAAVAAIGAATQAQMELLAAGEPASAAPLGIAVAGCLLAMAALQYAANAASHKAGTLLATAATAAAVTALDPLAPQAAIDSLLVVVLTVGVLADRTRARVETPARVHA